ncbi:MAG: hypothetical protein AB6733_10940 [Clostridiaceae bacterium]
MQKDKFIIKPQAKNEGFKNALVDVATHELLSQMKEMTGVSITRLIEASVKFAFERMEIEE